MIQIMKIDNFDTIIDAAATDSRDLLDFHLIESNLWTAVLDYQLFKILQFF